MNVPAQVTAAFARACTAFGRVDVVLNNAGQGLVCESEGVPDADARALFEVNFWGAVAVTHEAVRVFREENPPGVGGRLVQISSAVCVSPFPGISYYSAS